MEKKAGKIALGLGLLTGAITGLLFAPDEGKNIRKKIAKGDTKGLLQDLENMGNEMKEMASHLAKNPSIHHALEKGKNMAAEAANLRREELDAMLKKANKKADAFKKTVATFVNEQKAMLEDKMDKTPKAKSSKKSSKKAVAKKPSKKGGAKKKK
ncbi:YtxH domain-containing protein [Candidatus Peregrinibacteria bacterium]|nr:MAG: YtxH domain-containing protein [Candidatus Peregrinibacteria bacterium]